jgi:hypothetical protein
VVRRQLQSLMFLAAGFRAWLTILLFAGFAACSCGVAIAADVPFRALSLDRGFRFLYDLDFDHAGRVFQSWEGEHPDDPLGPASDAAGLLFSELNRLGVLETQFYEDDKAFNARRKLTADPTIRDRFNGEVEHAESLSRQRLAKNPKDRDALFAMTILSGLKADYAALIEKRNLAALRYTRTATTWAQQVLAVDPGCYDAHLATGVSQYLVGSMAAPLRWFVRLGGVSGDKKAGIRELQLVAARGRYLAPFARILLAIAYVRQKDKAHARELLVGLRDEFPHNPLFAQEIVRMDLH